MVNQNSISADTLGKSNGRHIAFNFAGPHDDIEIVLVHPAAGGTAAAAKPNAETAEVKEKEAASPTPAEEHNEDQPQKDEGVDATLQ